MRDEEREYRIEVENLDTVNTWPGDSPGIAWVRSVLDDCLRNGIAIIVTDERDHEIGRVTARVGAQFVWERDLRSKP